MPFNRALCRDAWTSKCKSNCAKVPPIYTASWVDGQCVHVAAHPSHAAGLRMVWTGRRRQAQCTASHRSLEEALLAGSLSLLRRQLHCYIAMPLAQFLSEPDVQLLC